MLDTTLRKFGFPGTLVKEYKHWYLLCRFEQVTLGSLILISKEQVGAFSEISQNGFEELPFIVRALEKNLKELFHYEKINYLMLMMVDPEVHFHIIPRYSSDKSFEGTVFKDYAWPHKPDIDVVNTVGPEIIAAITKKLHDTFNG